QTFGQHIQSPICKAEDLLLLAREIILHVDSLHMQGIVHGAISPQNVIIGEKASVQLTHVSPLLYCDPKVDVEAVVTLLRQAVQPPQLTPILPGRRSSPAGQRDPPPRAFPPHVGYCPWCHHSANLHHWRESTGPPNTRPPSPLL